MALSDAIAHRKNLANTATNDDTKLSESGTTDPWKGNLKLEKISTFKVRRHA